MSTSGSLPARCASLTAGMPPPLRKSPSMSAVTPERSKYRPSSVRSTGRSAPGSPIRISFIGLPQRPAAVNDQGLAGDERGGVTAEEGDRVADVPRHAAPLQALVGKYLLVVRGGIGGGGFGGGRARAGQHRVDCNGLRPEFARERPGEPHDGPLRCHVVEEPGYADVE